MPEDFAIVAYDDEVASLASMPLIAVAPPKESVGRRAIEICLARIGDRGEGPMQLVKLTPSLRVRDSSSASAPGQGAEHTDRTTSPGARRPAAAGATTGTPGSA